MKQAPQQMKPAPKPDREWLFETLPEPRTAGSIIRWWEARRLFYNMVIGSVGLCSFLVFLFCITQANVLKPGEDAEEPLALLFAWVPVNICYTAGWVAEVLALRTGYSSRFLRGPVLMRFGMGFFAICCSSALRIVGNILAYRDHSARNK